MSKLWLDDVRKAPPGFHHEKTAGGALAVLSLHRFDEASLDHDLGSDRMSGLWFLRTAAQHGLTLPPTIHLHTQNPVGRQNMAHELEHLGYERDHSQFATFHLAQTQES